jgi:hypothetical protein
MAVTLNANSSTGFIATSDTSGVLQLQTGGTTALTVSAAQVVTLANPLPVASGGSGGTTSTGTGANVLGTTPSFTSTIGVGGATASASGAGITFPSGVSHYSTDANTLDDYEEGTWTPAYAPVTNSFTSISYGFNIGKYVKIGNMVYVAWRMRTSALTVGSGSGIVLITGLPFTSVGNVYLALGIGDSFAVNNAGSALVNESNANITLQQDRNNTNIVVTDLSTGSANNFTAGFACYQV